jgi:hypothetical protein
MEDTQMHKIKIIIKNKIIKIINKKINNQIKIECKMRSKFNNKKYKN